MLVKWYHITSLHLLPVYFSFPLATIPQPRQQVFPFFGTLQLLPSSHTSLKWYLFPKRLFNFQGTDCQLLTACHLFGSGSPLPSLSPFYHLPNRLSTFFLYFICYKHIEIMLYIPSIYIIVCCPCMAYNFGVFVLPDYGKFRCKAFSAAQWDFIPIMAKTAYNANLGLW